MDVFEKCSRVYNQVQEMSRSGFYFYFRRLESPQDSEVVVNGKRRAFVLVPLKDIAPDLMHPVLKRTVRDLLKDVDTKGVNFHGRLD